MNTLIIGRNLTRRPPHSPRDRVHGFAVAMRATDKCLAGLAGTLGTYHFECSLVRSLLKFKKITVAEFTEAARSADTYEDVGFWLFSRGLHRTESEIQAWSDRMEDSSPMNDPDGREEFIRDCNLLGLDPETTSTFSLIEEDDRASFPEFPQAGGPFHLVPAQIGLRDETSATPPQLQPNLSLMKTNPLKQGTFTHHSNGIGIVTAGMVETRAREIAAINGHSTHEATQADWDQARRELAGVFDKSPEDTVLESALESERWNPLAGSTGHRIEVLEGEDEDKDGRSDQERLTAQGLAGAEHDQMLQAARRSAHEARRGS